MRAERVGGTYWGAQPDVPSSCLLIRAPEALASGAELVGDAGRVVLWCPTAPSANKDVRVVVGDADPWHMLASARALVCRGHDETRLVAAMLDIPTFVVEGNGGPPVRQEIDAAALLSVMFSMAGNFINPFTGGSMTLAEAIGQCAFWRSLIDSNRDLAGGSGFAFWKQDSVLPLLWGGGSTADFFAPPTPRTRPGARAIWRSKTPESVVEKMEANGTTLVEVEDGFLRSAGLGADCVPPMSITVDRLGAYFDASRPSELEHLLQNESIPPALLERARQLRERIVAAGLGKYDRSQTSLARLDPVRRHVLVTGQVEDDRSILTGGGGLVSNLELLQRVRARRPDDLLIYKPHPDVVAGHRKGNIHEPVARQFADVVITDASISSLIAMVDEVHVNTSLAGFEALLRHKDVTTHGVPFYAGWGLTRDLGPVPARRTRRRSLDELVAATLLIYPRYLDPVTGLPCPAEVVVDRLCGGAAPRPGLLVSARRLQGQMRRYWQRWAQ